MSAVYLASVLFVGALAFVVGWVASVLLRPHSEKEHVHHH